MSLIELRLDTLKDLDDGRAAVAYRQAVELVTRDCADRPGDKRPRKILLELVLMPVLEPDGDCRAVQGQFKIKTTVPQRQTKTYSFGIQPKQGRLFFSKNAPENVDQTTFADVDPKTGRADQGPLP